MSKEAHKIAARIAVRTFPVDTLEANHRIKAWDEGRVDIDLDPNDPVVKAHRLNRIVIPDEKLMECLTAEEVGFSTWTRFFGGTKVTGTIMLNTETEIRLVIKLSGAERDSKAPTGMAVINTTVAEISRAHDVQKLCLPTAGRAYRTLRSALYRGDASEIGIVQDGLSSRLWQLDVLSRCKHEVLRDKLGELVTIMDVFFESAVESADPEKAVEMIDHFIGGGASLTEELDAKVKEARELLAAEKARKARSIATVEDMMAEKERERQRRKAQKAKRSKSTAASAAITAEEEPKAADVPNQDEVGEEPVGNEEVEAGSAETESESTEAPTAATEKDANSHLTPKQQRLFAEAEARKQAADSEAPKPTKPEAPKAEPVKLDFKAALAARKAATTVAADSAPATETAPSEPAKSE